MANVVDQYMIDQADDPGRGTTGRSVLIGEQSSNELAKANANKWYSSLSDIEKEYLRNKGYGSALDVFEKAANDPSINPLNLLGTKKPFELLKEMDLSVSPEATDRFEKSQQVNEIGMNVLREAIKRQEKDRGRRTEFLDQSEGARKDLVDSFNTIRGVADTGETSATRQLRESNQASDRSLQAMAASQTSGSGLASRGAAGQIAMMNPQQRQAEEALRKQEQINAIGQLGGIAGAIRGRGLEGAGLASGSEQGYVNAALTGVSGYQNRELSATELDQEREALGMTEREYNDYKAQQGRASTVGILGSMASGTAPIIAEVGKDVERNKDKDQPSDRSLKTDIGPANMDRFLSKLTPSEFNYTKKGQALDKSLGGSNSDDRQIGVMAQDLEKSPLGASMVKDTKDGKTVDVGKAAMASLASNAYLKERIDSLEGALRNEVKSIDEDVNGQISRSRQPVDQRREMFRDSPRELDVSQRALEYTAERAAQAERARQEAMALTERAIQGASSQAEMNIKEARSQLGSMKGDPTGVVPQSAKESVSPTAQGVADNYADDAEAMFRKKFGEQDPFRSIFDSIGADD